jgi:hypothetical protein
MSYNLKPIIRKIIKVLNKHGLIKKSLCIPRLKSRGLFGTFGCSEMQHPKGCGFNPISDIIKRMRGDHIVINGNPPLKRPIVLVNKKELSNAVRLNLLKECEEYGIRKEELSGIF